jgi:hypothetical protein
MRKPVYLAILGVSIVVAAISLGVTLTRFLSLLAYSPKGTSRAPAVPAVPGIPAARPEEWNNLFAPGEGMKLASRLPAIDAKTGSNTPRSNFVLVGTIVSSTPSASRAVLWTNGMKEPKAFREKEEIEPGAFLASVERDKAWITRGNEREKLDILPVGSSVRSTAPAAARPVPPPVAVAASPEAVPAVPAGHPTAVPAARPSPGGTQSVAPNRKASDEEEDEPLSPRERRRRAQGLRR